MDILAFGRMLRRRWLICAAGALLAVVAAVLAMYQPTSAGLAPRASATYQSDVRVLLSAGLQSLVSSQLPPNPVASAQPSDTRNTAGERYTNQDLNTVADVYAQLVTSDSVMNQVQSQFGNLTTRGASLTGYHVLSKLPGQAAFSNKDKYLPILDISSTASNPAAARRLAELGASSFISYIGSVQDQHNVPAARRVVLTTIEAAKPGERTSSSPLPLLGLIFLGGLVLTVIVAATRDAAMRRRPALSHTTVEPAGKHSAEAAAPPDDAARSRPVVVLVPPERPIVAAESVGARPDDESWVAPPAAPSAVPPTTVTNPGGARGEQPADDLAGPATSVDETPLLQPYRGA